MGGKNSGRFKKGTKKTSVNPQTSQHSVKFGHPGSGGTTGEPPEETTDFESNADRILRESAAAQAEILKEQPKIQTTENQNSEPLPLPEKKKEDWSPVVGFFMGVAGQIFENVTGFKEMNYTEDEIKNCSEAASEIINVIWPDVTALTEDQKIMIVNSMIILKIHVDKMNRLKELKEKKLNESTRADAAKPAA